MNVPAIYRGVWRRTLLTTSDCMDISSRVYWLQTGGWHGDIRIPPDRPSFSGITSHAECSSEQLTWLAKQQGFAGITVVTGNQCEWQRVIDFHPPSGKRDIGRMHFIQPDKLLESGIEDVYGETWERVIDDQTENCFALQLLNQSEPAEPVSYLLVSGKHFIYLRSRPVRLTEQHLQFNPQDAQVFRQLDFEISFGLRYGASSPWQITLSTLPWREGDSLYEKESVLIPVNGMCQESNSGDTWRVLCWNPE